MNSFTVFQSMQCVCSWLFCSGSGQELWGASFPSACSPLHSPAPGANSLYGPCPGSLQLIPSRPVQLGLLQTFSGKLLQICASFMSPSRSQDTFCPELPLSTCWSSFNCSGMMSSMPVSLRGVIFVESLSKVPSASFELQKSGKIDF